MTKEKIQDKLSYKQLLTITLGLMGLIGSLASIYALISSQKEVSLQCDIISTTNVLDINTEISDLDILFKQSSLKKANKNLKLVIIKIKNDGTEDILKTFYDDKAPFGIKPLVGQIVEKPEIIETSNDYLKDNLDITIDSTGIIYFSNVIIDRKEQFTFKLLTLVDKGSEPKFEITGKIAGINGKIEIGLFETQVELPFFKQVFLGDVWVQLIKSVIYFLIIAILIIIIAISSESISDRLKKKKRTKRIEDFKKSDNYVFHHIDSVIFEMYQREEDYRLMLIQEELKDITQLAEKYERLTEDLESEKEKSDKRKGYTEEYYMIKEDLDDIKNFIDNGFILKTDEKFIVNETLKNTLDKFIKFCGIEKMEYSRFRNLKMHSGVINSSQHAV